MDDENEVGSIDFTIESDSTDSSTNEAVDRLDDDDIEEQEEEDVLLIRANEGITWISEGSLSSTLAGRCFRWYCRMVT